MMKTTPRARYTLEFKREAVCLPTGDQSRLSCLAGLLDWACRSVRQAARSAAWMSKCSTSSRTPSLVYSATAASSSRSACTKTTHAPRALDSF